MKMGIGFDMLLVMVLSVMALDCNAAETSRKDLADNNGMKCAEEQLKSLQIVYGLDNAVAPQSGTIKSK